MSVWQGFQWLAAAGGLAGPSPLSALSNFSSPFFSTLSLSLSLCEVPFLLAMQSRLGSAGQPHQHKLIQTTASGGHSIAEAQARRVESTEALTNKLKSYVKDEYHAKNKNHIVPAWQLADDGSGYFYTIFTRM